MLNALARLRSAQPMILAGVAALAVGLLQQYLSALTEAIDVAEERQAKLVAHMAETGKAAAEQYFSPDTAETTDDLQRRVREQVGMPDDPFDAVDGINAGSRPEFEGPFAAARRQARETGQG